MIGRSAKSHQYYYYTCNGNFKQGAETCTARALPKDKLERVIVEQIREKVLNNEWLQELVELVNKELDSSHTVLGDRLDAIDADLNEVRLRLSRLYEALETSKLSLDDLAPRIKEQRARESELSKARLQVEAEMLVQGPNHVDGEMIKAHAKDLKEILEEADLITSKAFLRTFIKRIEIKGDEAIIRYALPVPPQRKITDRVSVRGIYTPSGPGGHEPAVNYGPVASSSRNAGINGFFSNRSSECFHSGWGRRIRTFPGGSRVRCPTARRFPSNDSNNMIISTLG